MKMLIVLLCGIVCATCSDTEQTQQIKFDLEMRKKLVAEVTRENPLPSFMTDSIDLYEEPNFYIRSLFTGERITDLEYKPRKFDLYSFNLLANESKIILIYGNCYTFLNPIYDPYEKVVVDVLKFFKKNPAIDERLLPLCIQKITLQYINNRRCFDQFGPWREWFKTETTDSLAIEYRDYLYWKVKN